jgi:hypothetical protein
LQPPDEPQSLSQQVGSQHSRLRHRRLSRLQPCLCAHGSSQQVVSEQRLRKLVKRDQHRLKQLLMEHFDSQQFVSQQGLLGPQVGAGAHGASGTWHGTIRQRLTHTV